MTLFFSLFQVLGVSFSPNGYLLATGSEDNFCRIWDLRKREMLYSIPAHKSLISHVKFEPQEGYYLATSSYDTKAAVSFIWPSSKFVTLSLHQSIGLSFIPYFQLWSARDYKPIKSLVGHESKVTSLDISGGNLLLYPSCLRMRSVLSILFEGVTNSTLIIWSYYKSSGLFILSFGSFTVMCILGSFKP
jgi:WD40 repeat protein